MKLKKKPNDENNFFGIFFTLDLCYYWGLVYEYVREKVFSTVKEVFTSTQMCVLYGIETKIETVV